MKPTLLIVLFVILPAFWLPVAGQGLPPRATSLPAARLTAYPAGPDTLGLTTDSATARSDAGMPGGQAAQPLATPLNVIFVDPLHGWSSDATQSTTDGGLIWTPAYVPGPAWPRSAAFVSSSEGWVGGSTFDDWELCHEFIDHTTDGGSTWSRQYTSPARYGGASAITSLYFVDNLYGWGFGYAAMDGPISLKTTDGGITWRPTNLGIGSWLKMLDRTRWFRLAGILNRLSRTTDAGNSWSEVCRLPSWGSVGPYIAPDGKFMIVVGEAGRIARSTDGGATWVEAPSPSTADLTQVALADDAAGWAAGAGGAVLHTSDGGLSWTPQQIDTAHEVTWLAAFNPNDALLSAERLYRTADGGAHWLALPTGSVEAWQTGARPTIDGQLWEWQALPATHLDRANATSITGSETYPSPSDLSADLRSAWRPGVLYFAVAVTDDVLIGSQNAKAWNDDAVELSVHVPTTGKTHQFTIGLDGRQYENGNAISSLSVFTRTVPGGWTLETVIPAWVIGLDASLAAGQAYPFTFALWDDDTYGLPAQTHMIWRGADTGIYHPAWGTLSLSSAVYDFPTGATQTPTPTSTATPTPTATASRTPTGTPTASTTPTQTTTATPTASRTATATATPTETSTPTKTPTASPTLSATPTTTPSYTPLPKLYLSLVLR